MTSETFPATSTQGPKTTAASALATFVACAQLMLDAATPEALRLEAESRLLEQLPVVRALGLFELFSVRDAALAALLRDELEKLQDSDVATFRRAHSA
ncbi:MAG TPA: hypothetical protein VFK31_10615 [Rhodanobacteraceae bacterium]|nr:hypothetical protein [Rhodanobacteraceae bacterium]